MLEQSYLNIISGKARGPFAAAARGLLALAEIPYAAAMRWRNRRLDHIRPAPDELPTISVGNITAGGTGVMPVYASSGAAVNSPHMVTGTVAVNGSGTVTLSGAAVFSGAGSYTCTATMQSSSPSVFPVGVQNVNGSSFTIYGGFAGNVNYICVGN